MKLIVPYRNRELHLAKFAFHYHMMDILIVEQANNKLFNRGKLLNIGFNECKDDIVCFHDVDLLCHEFEPYNKKVKGAVHLSGLCEQFNYRVPYATCFGGVTVFDAESFLKCNGFSNEFWGWGGEDDDLYNRTQLAGIDVRFDNHKYYSLQHTKQPITDHYNVNKYLCTQTRKTWRESGLNSFRYKVLGEREEFGLKIISVDL